MRKRSTRTSASPSNATATRDAQLALNRRVSPLILRRTKDQVATELPPKTELIHGIELNNEQNDLYESVRAAMDKRVRDAIAAKGLGKSHIIFLDALLKLRQICCHPQLLKIGRRAEGRRVREARLPNRRAAAHAASRKAAASCCSPVHLHARAHRGASGRRRKSPI